MSVPPAQLKLKDEACNHRNSVKRIISNEIDKIKQYFAICQSYGTHILNLKVLQLVVYAMSMLTRISRRNLPFKLSLKAPLMCLCNARMLTAGP